MCQTKRKSILVFLFGVLNVAFLFAAGNNTSRNAEFPGGNSALATFLLNNVKYPEEAMKNNEIGKVFVTFSVDKDGSILDTKVTQGVSPSLDAEAVRVVNSMPKWTPAMKEGKETKTMMTLPIVFHLPNQVLDK